MRIPINHLKSSIVVNRSSLIIFGLQWGIDEDQDIAEGELYVGDLV